MASEAKDSGNGLEDDPSWFKARNILSVIGFWAFVTNYMARININLAIVEMVKPRSGANKSDEFSACPGLLNSNGSTLEDADEPLADENASSLHMKFDWDEKTQTLILSSIYFGYLSTQLIGGRLAERLGGKLVFGLPLFITGILSALTPIAAKTCDYPAVVVLRILIGMCQGVSFPAMLTIVAQWIPPLERSRATAVIFSGTSIGTICTFAIGGIIIDKWGWEASFYFCGICSAVWFAFWLFLAYSSPFDHPRISEEERAYLQRTIRRKKDEKVVAVPWKMIFKSVPFWSLVVTHMGSNYGYATLLTQLPTYMKNMLHFDIRENGLVSSLPYMMTFLWGLVQGRAMDKMLEKGWLSVTNVRKISNVMAQAGPAFCFLAAAYVECSRSTSVALFCLAGLFQGCVFSGYLPNHVDLAPNFAGSIMGFSNSAAAISSWLAPNVAGLLTTDQQTVEAWRAVFLICTGIMLFDAVEFAIFASGEEQPFNHPLSLNDEATIQTDAMQYQEESQTCAWKNSRKSSDLSVIS